MTNKELIEKLETAQRLLSDVYHWADEKEGECVLPRNENVRNLMSCADGCIYEALNDLDFLE